ncbi:hypothetical protein CEXT_252631 [Caerostris extrusa]|uniref:Uncharacterized protein n=1 Tax=Caerostris extrusa TaxID=172846 RepID=A0AAV4MYH3_CAEEX|nr:hypothetical protein CEXT_252631 [Caerostris extrusa]
MQDMKRVQNKQLAGSNTWCTARGGGASMLKNDGGWSRKSNRFHPVIVEGSRVKPEVKAREEIKGSDVTRRTIPFKFLDLVDNFS